MNIYIHPDENGTEVVVQGELTIYSAVQAKSELFDVLANHADLKLDLSGVGELDSAGVQVLLVLKQEAERQDKKLRLVNHSDAAVEVFELLHLAPFFGDPVLLRAERASA